MSRYKAGVLAGKEKGKTDIIAAAAAAATCICKGLENSLQEHTKYSRHLWNRSKRGGRQSTALPEMF